MIVFIIGFILIAIVAWFMFSPRCGKDEMTIASAIDLLKSKGLSETEARDFLSTNKLDTDGNGCISETELSDIDIDALSYD